MDIRAIQTHAGILRRGAAARVGEGRLGPTGPTGPSDGAWRSRRADPSSAASQVCRCAPTQLPVTVSGPLLHGDGAGTHRQGASAAAEHALR
jgi:hypothetical protein